MSQKLSISWNNPDRPRLLSSFCYVSRVAWLVFVVAMALLSSVMAMTSAAQTVTLTPSAPQNFWAGVNTTNKLAGNNILVVETNGGVTTNIVLSLLGVNGTTVFGNFASNTMTANGTNILTVIVTNAATGYYPLTVNASGDASASVNYNLFVVPQWKQTNVNSTGNWSDSTMWSGGATPLSTDGVYFEHQIPGPWTNVCG